MQIKPVITVPIYQDKISQDEYNSLIQLRKVLGHYPIYFIHPEDLDLTCYKDFQDFQFTSFDPNFFKGIPGYNKLMTSQIFYQKFTEFSHLLIYQLDAYVFSDDLTEWCKKDYSYIGSPWFQFELSELKEIHEILPLRHRFKILSPLRKLDQTEWLVGNGGFSLRRIQDFLDVLEKCQGSNEMKRIQKTFNEDNFWSFTAPKISKNFKIPKWRDALSFSFELHPDICFKLNNSKLPFGCHAWDKFNKNNFWKIIREQEGNT